MKKVLLGTTAMVAAGLLAAPAMAADPVKVGINGYMMMYFSAGHMGGITPAATGIDFRTPSLRYETEIQFIGQTKLDNGTTIGVRIELEGYTQNLSSAAGIAGNDQMDEEYIFAFGDWGRIEFGATDPAAYKMFYAAPTALFGFGAAQGFNLAIGSATGGGGANGAHHGYLASAELLSDTNKLTYYTPRFFGLQLGVSYTPYGTTSINTTGNVGGTCGFGGGAGGNGGPFCPNQSNAYVNGVSVGVNYVNKFGDFGVAVAVGWDSAYLNRGAVGTNAGVSRDYHAFFGGLNLSYAGFTVGGSFGWDNNGQISGNENIFWSAGIMYETGPWAASFTYFGGKRSEATAALAGTGGAVGADTVHTFYTGVAYSIGPGVQVIGGFYYEAASGQTQSERSDSWQFIIGSVIRF